MVKFINLSTSEPYNLFTHFYNDALNSNQKAINAIVISSFDQDSNEVDSRFVNLKYINNEDWIFFSNYSSPKAKQFDSHKQITAAFYWNEIDVQIRIKASIKKCDEEFSDFHFKLRDHSKNALAISSNQSEIISSYQDVKDNFEKVSTRSSSLSERPNYWGGFSFLPYSMEFWQGDSSRVNKRTLYKLNDNLGWIKTYLQP